MGYRWRKTLRKIDCRPKSFQLSKISIPKNTTQCNFFCPYYFLCKTNLELKKRCPMSYPQENGLTKEPKAL